MRSAFHAAIIGGAGMLIAAAPAAPDPFPAGEGHDVVVRVCAACHDPRIVTQQRLSPEGWHEIVDQMAARGAKASDAELDQITAYLAKAFPDTPKP